MLGTTIREGRAIGGRAFWRFGLRDVICLCAACLLPAGCSQFRGVPTHGGGKRFDEEQRAVAGAIRRTVACMDLMLLQDRKATLVVNHLYTSGTGTVNWPGPQNLGVYGNVNPNDYHLRRTVGGGVTDETRHEDRGTVGGNLSYRVSGSYRAANQGTEGDIAYFRAALEMKARHAGISMVRKQPDVILYVLVDVLGTNRSRRDYAIVADEELLASCEVTYYAQDVSTGKLLFRARQTGAYARYSESRVRFFPCSSVNRSICHAKPVYFDVDGNGSAQLTEAVDLSTILERTHKDNGLKDSEREYILEALYDRGKFHLESGNGEAAREYIDRLREIDPGYRGLGELSEDVERLLEER